MSDKATIKIELTKPYNSSADEATGFKITVGEYGSPTVVTHNISLTDGVQLMREFAQHINEVKTAMNAKFTESVNKVSAGLDDLFKDG